MPHVSLVSLSGFRVREPEMRALGMSLPGLHERAEALSALPGLGLLTLAAVTPAHWSISYHEPADCDEALEERLASERPTVVAISALTASIGDAYRLADGLRRRGVRVAMGGLHVTTCPDEAADHADAVVVGEGEPVWAGLLCDAERGRLRGRYRGAAPFALGAAPIPRFDLLGPRPRPRFTLQTARGCPLACEFCGASRLLGTFREKPASLVARELEAIGGLTRRPVIELADDNTFAGRRDPEELLDVLAASKVRWFTEVDWRIGERPRLLGALAGAGCAQVLVGVESLSPGGPGMGAKAAPLPRVLDAIAAIQEAGVAVLACFVVGGDGEDHGSLAALGEFLVEAPFADVQLTLLTPFPGTPLRARLERKGRLLPERGWSACTLFDVAFQPDRLTVAELERAFQYLVAMVFAEGPARRRAAIRRAVAQRRPTPETPA